MTNIMIDGIEIGRNCKPFIVAEAGINHNGDINKALKMITVAKNAGANAIKFQTFNTNEFILNKKLTYTYFSRGRKITKSQYDLFKKCELTINEWKKIRDKCIKEKIIFLSTPENISDLDLLLKLGIKAIKVSSDEMINYSLLKHFSKTKLPIILSTGMSSINEIKKALETIGVKSGYPTVLLLTTSEYPTKMENVNLLKLNSLKQLFPNTLLGFSDHSQGILASTLACALGACFFEKHFTLSHRLDGPDHWFSMNPKELKEWIIAIRNSYSLLGSKIIQPTKIELSNRKKFRRTVVAIRNISKNEKFNIENIGLRRTSGRKGKDSSFFEKYLAKKANKDYKKGEAII